MTSNIALSSVADRPSNSEVANAFFDTRGFLPARRRDTRENRSQVVLDPTMQSPEVEDFARSLRRRVVGQDRAIRQLARIYQVYLAGLSAPGRPLANLLLLGPTGSGKTRLVEAAAEALFGDARAVVKIDCAEFQHGHEIAKLVGSPPGYLGHRETHPLITQETLEQHYTEKVRVSLVLFDEIEKASDAVWQLLLGILDKATLTLGDNRRVDFSHSLIFLTSNLGSQEMTKLVSGGLGYTSGPQHDDEEVDQKIYRTAMEAARRKFSPEFMNRIDKTVVFNPLGESELKKILNLELEAVEERVSQVVGANAIRFTVNQRAQAFLLREGTDLRYGARHLKRAVERLVVEPTSNLLATQQLEAGDSLLVDFDADLGSLTFLKEAREIAPPRQVSSGKSAAA